MSPLLTAVLVVLGVCAFVVPVVMAWRKDSRSYRRSTRYEGAHRRALSQTPQRPQSPRTGPRGPALPRAAGPTRYGRDAGFPGPYPPR